MLADTFIGLFFGLIIGIFIGMGIYNARVDFRCEKGWHWKDVNYAYSCTAEKRP